ncbi:DUF4783 domain-containing protein [Halosquirtibacter xylanolyticus]|uniref:DUF4783 domain-containing protein n=1 Tax=Halosquirtibacter xylanolyticus TaxID=3374599 RepID=UPI003749C6A1|nr:DUF4783 domain-containing protein [Prolixibacteraceae bacterium]
MKSFIHKSFFTFLLIGISCIAKANVVDDIASALKQGDSGTLSSYFNDSVELVVVSKEGIYSKNQAEIIVSTFFNENRPSKFVALHQGGKAEATYVIGKLETSNGNYRVYYLVKGSGGSQKIYQLRFEKE